MTSNPGKPQHTLLEVYNHLPQTNCKKCGYPSCMVFAIKLLKREVFIDACTVLKEPKYFKNRFELKQIEKEILKARETNLVIRPELCTGCGNCLVVCPRNEIVSQETAGGKGPITNEVIMRVKGGSLISANLGICRRLLGDDEMKLCNLCVHACPIKGAIEFI